MCIRDSLSGCAIPIPGFADYDVSGYVKALLDSSYHQENEEFMSITGATKTAAQQNNTDTVENAAVLFCNTYGLYPNEEQLQELQEVMRTVYRQTQYTCLLYTSSNRCSRFFIVSGTLSQSCKSIV